MDGKRFLIPEDAKEKEFRLWYINTNILYITKNGSLRNAIRSQRHRLCLSLSQRYDDKEYAICEIKAWATPTELTSWSCWTSLLDKRKWAHEWKLVTFGGIDWTTIQFRSNKIADLRNMLKLEDLPFCFVILCIYNVLAEKLFKVLSLLQLGCMNGSDLHSVQAL